MFTHLTRRVKEKLESLKLKKFVSDCSFDRVNYRILKSNFGVCHQLRNQVSCAANSGINSDNDDKFGKNRKDSWTHSVHLEHSPIGLLGWSTALAIGWCMTQPFSRKCVLPTDRSSWDQASSLTKTVFAQPGGLTKLDRYLKYNVTNTVFTQTDNEETDKGNSASKSKDSSLCSFVLTKLDRYLNYNANNTVFTQTDIENNDKENSANHLEDRSLSNSVKKKLGGYLKYDFIKGTFTEVDLEVNDKRNSASQLGSNFGLIKLNRNPTYNVNNTVFTQTDIVENNKEKSVCQSKDFSRHKTETSSVLKTDGISLKQPEYSSGIQPEYSLGNQSEHSLGSQSEHSLGSQSEHSLGSQSEHSLGSQSEYSLGSQSGNTSGSQSEYSYGNQSGYISGNESEYSFGSPTKSSPGCEALVNSGHQAKDSSKFQAKPHSDENTCCDSRPIHPKLLEAAENLAKIQNSVFADFDNRLGVKDIKAGKSKAAVAHFAISIELENKRAMFNMGLCYEMGLGVEKDLARAAVFYKMAAQRGHRTAIYNLGVFHVYGWGGVTKDPKYALKLFKHAASHGQEEAKNACSTLSSYLEKKEKKRSSENETGCDSNTYPLSSVSDSQTVEVEDHSTSQK